MGFQAVCIDLEQYGLAFPPDVADRVRGSGVKIFPVPCVAGGRPDSKSFGAHHDVARNRVGRIGRLCDAIVLEDEKKRQFPLRSDVEALIQRAFAKRPITDKGDRDLAAPLQFSA